MKKLLIPLSFALSISSHLIAHIRITQVKPKMMVDFKKIISDKTKQNAIEKSFMSFYAHDKKDNLHGFITTHITISEKKNTVIIDELFAAKNADTNTKEALIKHLCSFFTSEKFILKSDIIACHWCMLFRVFSCGYRKNCGSNCLLSMYEKCGFKAQSHYVDKEKAIMYFTMIRK